MFKSSRMQVTLDVKGLLRKIYFFSGFIDLNNKL